MKIIKKISIILIVLTCVSYTSKSVQFKGYVVGDVVADFSLKNIDDKMVSLKDFKNSRGVIIIFTSNTCSYSLAYEDKIISLDNKYKNKGFPIIAINSNDPIVSPGDSYEKMQERAKEKSYTFPYLFDEDQNVLLKFGVNKTPYAYVLEKRNDRMIIQYIGVIDDSFLGLNKVKRSFVEEAIASILNGKKPIISNTEVQADGCTVRTKLK
ncbi:MAG TPA: thioredoxin family protein [Tenacibaculum sp.]|nr:thioredoxin family protein [Tenacibaculum sp.]